MTSSVAPADSAAFDLRSLLRADDWIVCGQAAAEPLTLTCLLMDAGKGDPGTLPLTVFLGTTLSSTFDSDIPAGMRFASYGAMGRAASLADRGLLDVLPERYGTLAGLFVEGALRADVVLLQAAPGGPTRPPSLGLANDYTLAAARRARVVVVEVNASVPWTHGAALPHDLHVDHWIAADRGPIEMLPGAPGPVEEAIARHVASIVPDGATLQTGIGNLPDAALRQLGGHRHLGIHSGVLGDAAAQLVRDGAVSNACKTIDAGITVTNTVIGSAALYRWVDDNAAVEVRPASYTHAAEVLGRLHRLCAVNAALQVDLSGQVNCESVGGRQRGGVGGLLDFSRAARLSPGGRAITVLPATADGGRQSRIVLDLAGNPATIGRADVDLVVTEFGTADLRRATLDQRAQRLIAIAAPAFRDALARDWRHSTWGKKAWH